MNKCGAQLSGYCTFSTDSEVSSGVLVFFKFREICAEVPQNSSAFAEIRGKGRA